MKMNFIDVYTTDPAFNLALEQYVFDCMPRDRGYFMLWQNKNAIIIGKHQNTLAEINLEYVQQHGIKAVRRLSGGGAVYHDLGNLNFTYIVNAEGDRIDLSLFCKPVAEALRSLGVNAEVNGRNDIVIDGMKFSGNAQYVREGRVMHHGTILFDSDLSVVGSALKVNREKLQSKGIKSVQSRVTTIRPHLKSDITIDEFRRVLREKLFEGQNMEEYRLTEADIAAVERIKAERYDTYEWNYGLSPACTLFRQKRIEGCGTVEAHIAIENGLISNITFTGDFFSASDPNTLAERFVGIRPDSKTYEAILCGIDVSQYFTGLNTLQLIELLTQ